MSFEVQLNRSSFHDSVHACARPDVILCSAERIRDFLVIEQEPLPSEQGKPPAYWPSSGNIRADHLSAQYSKGMLILLV